MGRCNGLRNTLAPLCVDLCLNCLVISLVQDYIATSLASSACALNIGSRST